MRIEIYYSFATIDFATGVEMGHMSTRLSVVTVLLAALTLLIAGLNGWLAWRTFKSQEGSKTLAHATKDVLTETKALQVTAFTEMNAVLEQMNALQARMNARDRTAQQQRARTAVDILITALERQKATLDGQWPSSHNADPLQAIRGYQVELSWIPDCPWKTRCQDIFHTIGLVDPWREQDDRPKQRDLLVNHSLAADSPTGLYSDCQQAIDEMA